MTSSAATLPECSNTAAVLADAVRLRGAADDAERHLLIRGVQWAEAHRADPDEAAYFEDESGTLPSIRWDAGVEFALAVGLSHQAGERMLHEGLELFHRLGLVWSRVLAGDLPAWRARRVAAVTLGLPGDVAAFVDEHVAAIAHKVGAIKLAKIVDEAMLRLYPEEREQATIDALDERHVKMLEDISANGVATILINADLKDALDFTDRVAEIASLLKAAGCEEELEVRRALAVGVLADPARALALLESVPEPSARRKRMSLVVHISEAAIAGRAGGLFGGLRACGCACDCSSTRGGGDDSANAGASATFAPRTDATVARLERGDAPVLVAMIREWCGRADTDLSVIPVIDTTDHIAVDRYEIPDRLADQIDERTHACVFPWCDRPARRCDHDHNTPHGKGGATCSCNLAPLCRRHHRIKTHTAWSYETLSPGSYVWHSPFGRSYYRDHDGTVDVTLPGEPQHGDGCQRPEASTPDAPGAWDDDRFRSRSELLATRLAIVDERRGPGGDPVLHRDGGPDEYDPTRDLDPRELTDRDDPYPSLGARSRPKPRPDDKPPF